MKQKVKKLKKLRGINKEEEKQGMWPFKNTSTQKGVSIVLLIAGIALLFFPIESISNNFMVGVILATIGAIYLIDLK